MTRDEVRKLFDYDAISGELRLRASNHVIRENSRRGYRQVMVKGKMYYAHRLIWLLVYGEWPSEVDHINGRCGDNRLANLRIATRSQNMANGRMKKTNRSGFKGVLRDDRNPDNPWIARIKKNYVSYHLGCYPTPELAHAAYCEAATSMHGEFARRA